MIQDATEVHYNLWLKSKTVRRYCHMKIVSHSTGGSGEKMKRTVEERVVRQRQGINEYGVWQNPVRQRKTVIDGQVLLHVAICEIRERII